MSWRGDRAAMMARYRWAPVLRAYDEAGPHLHPYLILNTARNHQSAVMNTDAEGFRHSTDGSGPVTADTWWSRSRRGIVVGGSLVFGVGASDDRSTIPSQLASLSGAAFLNLGIRAGNSTQEVAATVPFLGAADLVVVCSGANNLIAALQSEGRNERFGPFYFEGSYDALRRRPLHDIAAILDEAASSTERMRRFASTVLRRPARPAGADQNGPSLPDRAELALRRQIRDLRLIMRGARSEAVKLFVVQPFADLADRPDVPEERALYQLHDALQGDTWRKVRDFAVGFWPEYRRRLIAECGQMGVAATDLPAAGFTGWAFLDRVHLTDSGYRQAAERIAAAVTP